MLVSVIFEKQVLPESAFGWFSQSAVLEQCGFTSDISEKLNFTKNGRRTEFICVQFMFIFVEIGSDLELISWSVREDKYQFWC